MGGPWLAFWYAYTHGDLGLQSQPKDVVLEFDKRIKNPLFLFLLVFICDLDHKVLTKVIF